MRGASARGSVALLSLALLGWSGRARGQEAQKAASQALFDQARQLANQGKYAEACPKFAESLRLERGIGTLLWLADCYENVGKTASAWADFREAAAAAALQHDPREQVAEQRAAALQPKLVKLVIAVPSGAAVPGLVVQRDEFPVGSAEWGDPVPVDPGRHSVSAKAPHKKTWVTTVDLAPGVHVVTVNVPLLEAEPAAVPAAPMTSSAQGTGDAEPPGRTQRMLALGAGGLGVVGLGVGTFLALRAKSNYDSSNDGGHCTPDNHCDSVGLNYRSDAYTLATGATIAFVAAGALIAGGALLYLTAPEARATTAARPRLVPALGPGGASMTLASSF